MTRNYIRDEHGNIVKNSEGERQFWSNKDGDSRPDTKQTTYSEHKGILGGSTKNKATYNPSTGKYNK